VTLIGQFLSTPKFDGVLGIGDHADLGKESIKNKKTELEVKYGP
jgi:hypothetical protein